MPEYEIEFSGTMYVTFENEEEAWREALMFIEGNDCSITSIQRVGNKTEDTQ